VDRYVKTYLISDSSKIESVFFRSINGERGELKVLQIRKTTRKNIHSVNLIIKTTYYIKQANKLQLNTLTVTFDI
jgi:hypothetical protein